MQKNTAIFLIVLVLILSAYASSSYKIGIYNNSGQTIDTLRINGLWKKEVFTQITPQSSIHLPVYAPFFNKEIRIKVKLPNQISNTIFPLRGPMRGEQYNQVEIGANGNIRVGQLAQ